MTGTLEPPATSLSASAEDAAVTPGPLITETIAAMACALLANTYMSVVHREYLLISTWFSVARLIVVLRFAHAHVLVCRFHDDASRQSAITQPMICLMCRHLSPAEQKEGLISTTYSRFTLPGIGTDKRWHRRYTANQSRSAFQHVCGLPTAHLTAPL